MSTKIHAICVALGNPIQFYLTSGEAHDLNGADVLLPGVEAKAFLADRAYDAQERVINKLQEQRYEVVIPSTERRKQKRDYDKHLYQARHLIENFFARLKQYRGIVTRSGIRDRRLFALRVRPTQSRPSLFQAP